MCVYNCGYGGKFLFVLFYSNDQLMKKPSRYVVKTLVPKLNCINVFPFVMMVEL